MAVSYVASVGRTGTTAGETSLGDTLTFAGVNAGAGDLMLALAVRRVTFTGNILSGVTYGAQNLTQLFQFNNYDGVTGEGAIAAFYQTGLSGTQDSIVTYTAATSQRDAVYYVLSGVDQSNPFGTVFTKHIDGSFNTINSNAEGGTAGVVGGMLVDCVGLGAGAQDSAAVVQAYQTFRHALNATTSDWLFTSTAPIDSSPLNTGWSWLQGVAQRNYIVIPINPASGQVVRVRGGGLLLGVG